MCRVECGDKERSWCCSMLAIGLPPQWFSRMVEGGPISSIWRCRPHSLGHRACESLRKLNSLSFIIIVTTWQRTWILVEQSEVLLNNIRACSGLIESGGFPFGNRCASLSALIRLWEAVDGEGIFLGYAPAGYRAGGKWCFTAGGS